MIIYKCNKDTERYLTKKKTEYWSGKPTDPEHLNYTKNAFAEVFKVGYPDGDEEYWTEVDPEEVSRLEQIHKQKLVIEPVFEKGYPSYEAVNRKENENETK